MRIAALYDIHGNLPALEAVFADVEREQPDVVLAGGDIVLGPMPRKSLEQLVALADRVRLIRGNTERALASATGNDLWDKRARWTGEQLSDDQRDFLAGLPETVVLEVDGLGATLFCHGTPRSDEEIVTRITPEERLSEILADVGERVVVCGHTHVQYDRIVGGIRIVNAGSVGMPYEDVPGARWALLGPDVELRRTPYDLEAAVGRIHASGYPEAAEFVDEFLLNPASADEATEQFERMAQAAR